VATAAQSASPGAMEMSQPAGPGAHKLQASQDRRQHREHSRPPLRRASHSAPSHMSARDDRDQTLDLFNLGTTLTGLSATTHGGLRPPSRVAFADAAQPAFPSSLSSFGSGLLP